MRYYEDMNVGEVTECGEYNVTEDEIISFAEKYDPQPFHIDKDAAKDSIFGELVSSGWLTSAICMRLLTEGRDEVADLAGVGVDNLRWHEPLKPGDTLNVQREVIDKQPSETRDDRGYISSRLKGFDQNDNLIISFEMTALFERRPE